MLILPPFRLHRPSSLGEALGLLRDLGPGTTLVAGGTDLLPNMKNGLLAPRHLVSLASVAELRGVVRTAETLRIGAATTLEAIAGDAAIRESAAALAEAAQAVGGPHHRRMGTLGGNICLDTRCRYFNQSAFWRSALGYCIKKDGDTCHVVERGRRCVAAASNDTGAALWALEASVRLVSPRGERTVAISDFYVADGVRNTVRAADEILVDVTVPVRKNRASAYEKLRPRRSIDFPMLSVAVRIDLSGDVIADASLVVSALAARPRPVSAAKRLVGAAPASAPVAAVCEAARSDCRPLPNIDGDVDWRREMVPVLVRRALARAGVGPLQPQQLAPPSDVTPR